MFWGLLLKANKRYSQVVQKAFHISHATLDVNNGELGEGDVVQVWIQADDANHLLCNLDKQSSHASLDLAFSEGETIAFYSKGAGVVHLTGFLLLEDNEYGLDGLGEEELDDEVSDEEVATSKKGKKGKAKSPAAEQLAAEEEEDDSELDENELLSDDDEDDDDELDEEEAEEEAEEEEDDDEEDINARPAKKLKIDKAGKQQNGVANGKAASKKEQKHQKHKDNKKEKAQPNANQSQPNANPNQSQQKPKPTRQLASGVMVEDLRTGKGPEAKSGRKISVFYEGRLKSNNKVFDSTKAGDGFKFNLGRGEVIRGWDIGVAGMKVGGKRRITCPPHVAYGSKGQPPAIPANSTLVFDVELRGVN